MSKTCKRRFGSSIGIAIVAVLAIGIAWNSLSVPAVMAVAGDGASGNIALLDTNANGKIDRITMNIANPNNATEPMTVNATYANCLSVTYGGAPVTISGTPSMAVSHPSVLTINLDETSVVVNTDGVNTASQFEVVYSQGAYVIGDCIDDTSDEYLNDIATGDSGITDTEADLAAPVIVSAVYQDSGTANGTVDRILTTWSENVTQTSAGGDDYEIGGGVITATFSSSADDLGGDTIIDITVTADANETGVNGGLEPTILHDVAGSGDPVRDESLATNIAVANGAGAITVTDDAAPFLRTDGTNAPKYLDANSDGTIDRVQLVFTENTTLTYDDTDWTIVAQGLTGLDVTALNSGSGTTTILLTATASAGITGVSGGTEPTIAFSDAAYLTDGTNPLATIGTISLVDGAAPQIKTFGYKDSVDLDGKIDTITLNFSETLDATSVLSQENLILTAGDFTLAAFGSLGVDLVGAVATVDIPLGTEASVVDTRSATLLTIETQDGVAAFSLIDSSLNENTTPKVESQLTDMLDMAKPVIKTVTPTDASTAQSRTNSVVYTFSEPMVADVWAEGTEFNSTPDGSGWSGTWSGIGNSTMTLTHSPFLCVQGYSIAFTPAQVTATGGESGYTELNIDSAAPIGETHTFTTMSCSSGSSSSSSSTTTEEDTTDEEETATDEEDTTTDDTTTSDEETAEETPTTGEQTYSPVTGELEDISVVEAGDFIKSPYFATVYYVTSELTRRPFMNSQTFFTYADSFAEVKTVTDATLTTLP
ncbi:Ig-like domain-containing protein, partial [Patescibacteria group bacterium]|nr:Ig-like domain-containing protein [Patescibacteria group bacterium]